MERCDVVVVGARCAGSPLAAWLARQGLRVWVLDRARFPSEAPSTHVIQPSGVRLLDQLGVLPAIRAADAVPLERFTLVSDDVRIDVRRDPATSDTPGLCVRRVTLDGLLVEAAERAGAQVRTGCRVTGLIHDGQRVCGVRTTQGDIHAALVVGADGRNSTVAAGVGADEYHLTAPGRVPAWAYFDGVGHREGHLRLGRRGELAYLASPTDGGLYLACVAPAVNDRDAFRRDRDAAFATGLAGWPELADLLAGARRVGPIRMMTDWHGYFRHATGPGWVLVGDAGHFKDFTPAQGISDALRQAQRLATAVMAGLGGNSNLAEELRNWWQWRDRDAYEMYWFAADLGAPGRSSPLITRLLRDIAADPEATQALLRVLNHDIPPSQLLTTRRLVTAAGRALRDDPDKITATIREIAGAIRDEARRARLRHTTGRAIAATIR